MANYHQSINQDKESGKRWTRKRDMSVKQGNARGRVDPAFRDISRVLDVLSFEVYPWSTKLGDSKQSRYDDVCCCANYTPQALHSCRFMYKHNPIRTC